MTDTIVCVICGLPECDHLDAMKLPAVQSSAAMTSVLAALDRRRALYEGKKQARSVLDEANFNIHQVFADCEMAIGYAVFEVKAVLALEISKMIAERDALIAAAYEAAALKIDCGGCNGDCPMPSTCCANDASAIRALTPPDAIAAQARLIREAHAAGMLEAAGIVDMHKQHWYDAYSHIIDLAAAKENVE